MRLRFDGRQLQYADLQLLSADAPRDRSHDRRGEDSRADNRLLSVQVRRESSVRADRRGVRAPGAHRVDVVGAAAEVLDPDGKRVLSLDEAVAIPQKRDVELIAIDDALLTLSQLDPQQSRIVELRFFGGLTIEETAEVLGVSPETIGRDWKLAKMWLLNELSGEN